MRALRVAAVDLGRLARGRAGVLLVLLPALAAGLRIAVHALGGAAKEGATTNGFGPMADGLQAGAAALTLVLFLLGSLLIVREQESGTLALATLNLSRGGVFASKVLALLTILVASAALLVATSVATAAWLFELGPVVEDGFEMASAGELWRDVARSLGAALPAWIAAASYALLVSTATSTTAAAVSLTLLPAIFFDFARELLGESWGRVFLTYVPLLGDGSPLSQLPAICRGYSDVFFEPGQIATAITVSAWQALLLLGMGWLVMRTRSSV